MHWMTPTPTATAPQHPITDQTLTRAQLEQLLAEAGAPLVFERCDFAGADLSRLDLRGIVLRDCKLAET
jgi:uncharacterized protein YjbI with pentapeptide repeats